MLDTGFNCEKFVNLVMARFTKSGVMYQQIRGRGTRTSANKKKSHFTIFDFVGNCDFHDDEDPLPRPPFSLQGGSQRAMMVFGGADALESFLARLTAAVFGSTDERAQERERPAGGLDA